MVSADPMFLIDVGRMVGLEPPSMLIQSNNNTRINKLTKPYQLKSSEHFRDVSLYQHTYHEQDSHQKDKLTQTKV
jgi:hypothetical protein